MISLEQEKNAPNWETANKVCLSFNYQIGFMLSCSWSILNAHRASCKRIQNKNDNLNDFGA
jgi:DNA-binding XRE family transcriptional regulator